MALEGEGIQVLAETPAHGRGRTLSRLLAGFTFGLLLAVGLGAGALYAWDAGYEGRVLPGIRAGTTDLAGLDGAGTAAAIGTAYAGYAEGRVVLRTEAGDIAIPYADFGRRVDVETMTAEALAAGRSGTVAERAVDEVRLALGGATVAPRLVLDEAALASRIEAALAALERRPTDALLAIRAEGIVTTPSRAGRRFDAAAATAAALEAVRRLDAPAEVVVAAPAIPVLPARGDSVVQAARIAAERMVGDVVIRSGKKHWTIKAATVRASLRFEIDPDGAIRPVAHLAAFDKTLARVAKKVKRKAHSAVFLVTKSGRVFGVAPGADGRKLDAAATRTAIADALAQRAAGFAAAPVDAVVVPYQPKLTTEEATRDAPLMTLLGSWRTWFPISERNYYGANIWLPARIINGTVLRPGERFEWWSRVGPITSGRGFGPGGYIAGNHTEPTGALGGGMCSSSTTLFNAALRAGLQMGARSNHRYYINRYPLGLDATVSKTRGGGGQTMSFTNDTGRPIFIRGYRVVSGGLGWVVYEIWGVSDGRTVSLSRPAVWNVRKATTRLVYTSTLARGVREQTEYPANGMDVSVTRVVRDRHGRVIHRDTYVTHYTLWNGVVMVGR